MNDQTIKCSICNKPYVVYSFYAGDQSACPKCRGEARKPTKKVVKDWREYYDVPTFQREITLASFK